MTDLIKRVDPVHNFNTSGTVLILSLPNLYKVQSDDSSLQQRNITIAGVT